jgi:preprotein translocase subunit Sec63
MQDLYFYMLIFVAVFSIYMIYLFFRAKSKRKKKMIEIIYLERRYKINVNELDIFKLNRIIALANSLIFTVAFFVMNLIENYILKTLVAFVMVFFLIWVLYGIIGNVYKNKK